MVTGSTTFDNTVIFFFTILFLTSLGIYHQLMLKLCTLEQIIFRSGNHKEKLRPFRRIGSYYFPFKNETDVCVCVFSRKMMFNWQ